MGAPATAAVRLLSGEREPVRVATTGNIFLLGLQTVDGVVLAVNDRVLVKSQSDQRENGIYTASKGRWYRASDASFSRAVGEGITVQVREGLSNGGKAYRFRNPSPQIGKDPIVIDFYLSANFAEDAEAEIQVVADQVITPLVVRAETAAQDVEGVGIVVENLDAILDAPNQAAAAETATAVAQAARVQAEAARDAAFVKAKTGTDLAATRALVADGEPFGVVSADGLSVTMYTRTTVTTQTLITSYPTKAGIDQLEANTFPIDYLPNPWPNGDFSSPLALAYQSGNSFVQESVSGIPELIDVGVAQAVRITPPAGSFTGFRLETNPAQTAALGILPGEKLILGLFVYSSTGDTWPQNGSAFTYRVDGATVAPDAGNTPKFLQLTPKLRLYFAEFASVQAGTIDRLTHGFANSVLNFPEAAGTRRVSGFFAVHGVGIPSPTMANWRRFTNWKGSPTRKVFVDQLQTFLNGSSASSTAATLVLGGANAESYVQVKRNGKVHKHTFSPFPTATLTAPSVFEPRQSIIDGKLLRSALDDPAPYRALGATIGARHGYFMDDCVAAAHGKVTADIGSVWQNGSFQAVLVGTKNTGALYLTQRDGNGAVPTGTFTHVSGATNTANIVVTSRTQVQFYPPFQNRKVRTVVDGIEVADLTGTFTFADKVVFAESYDVLPKSEVVAWFEANGKTGSVLISGRTPAFTVSLTHTFDHEGNYSGPQDFLALQSMPLQDIMFTQAQRSATDADGVIRYYVRKALPVVHAGQTYNYALIDSSDTSAWTSRLQFTPARCEPNGLLADCLIMLSDNYGFAVGYLPVGVASPEQRRSQATVKAMEISNSSGKFYPSAVDKGAITLAAGEYFSAIPYRVFFERSPDRTCLYAVRTEGADYLYVDWHNKVAIDRVPIPADFVGRDFEIVEKSANVVLRSNSLTSSIVCDVSTAGTYGYLILKVR